MKTITANDGKTYALPENPVWRDGPPPSVGWWPASAGMTVYALRWWDGRDWSLHAFPNAGASIAATVGASKNRGWGPIQWTDRWWLTPTTTKQGSAA